MELKVLFQSQGEKVKKCIPWWNEECSLVIRKRNKVLIRRNHNFEALIQYKKAQAQVRKTIKAVKKTCWR